ncbi:MAG: site-2 protease family protein [Verrucomicrobiota bacterium]
MGLFISALFTEPFYYLAWVGVVTFSICFHEYSHASMALKMGDDTAARSGHLSLNPVVQMGQASLIMLLLIGIAWGAVPVNVGRLPGRKAAALVSFAGPASNLLLCLVFGALAVGLRVFVVVQGVTTLASRFFALGCTANAVLFVFNMLPVPMLDGWPIFSLFFPALRGISMAQAQNISWILMAVLFISPLGNLIWGIGSGLAGLVAAGWPKLFSLFL